MSKLLMTPEQAEKLLKTAINSMASMAVIPRRQHFYILDENDKPVAESDMKAWEEFMLKGRRFMLSKIGHYQVSTAFTGYDFRLHHDVGNPLLWETLVFSEKTGEPLLRRYETYEEAVVGHDALCKNIRDMMEAADAKGDNM